MKLKYWTGFSKRKNSTKIPTATGTEIDVWWKEDTSIDAPSVVLATDAVNIDYCYINDWGKYYTISAITKLTDGTTQYDLSEDVMATHKTSIGSTVAQIAYSSTGWNKNIVDTRMAVRADKAYFDAQTVSSDFSSTGCYIVGIVNEQQHGRFGAINYYLMDETMLQNLMLCLTDSSLTAQIQQYFTGDWLQLIPSCIWIPISFLDAKLKFCSLYTLPEQLTVGKTAMLNAQSIEAAGYPVSSLVEDLSSVSLTIPYKWQDFRDCQPYTTASLYLVGIGETDLNINDFYESANVSIATKIDCTTGDITYRVYNDDGVVVKTVMFNGGTQVPLAHIVTNSTGALASVGGVVGGVSAIALSAATGNIPGVIGGGIATLSAASNVVASANHRSTSIKGTNTGRSSFANTTFKLTISALETEDIDNANYIATWGRPVAVNHAISNHSGYVQCDNASVNISGDNWERDEINSYLNSGFYYE